ncbi:MAG TPA: MBG domain-containing protein [Acetobacterium sp.]
MQIKKPEKQLLSLILMIFLIATCLPGNIFASVIGENDSITFSENVTYNGNPQVLAEMKAPAGGAVLDPTLIEITYEGNMDNGNPFAETTKPPTEPGIYLVTAQYEGDENYQSYSETKEIIIKPIELKLTDFTTKKPATKDYDGTTNVPAEMTEGLSNAGVLEKDISAVKFSYKSSKFISKDVKPVELNKIILNDVTISGDKATCYHLIPNPDLPNIDPILVIPNKDSATVELSGKITPKRVGMLLNGENKVYDADPLLDGYDLSYNADDVIKGEEIGVKTTDAFNPWYGNNTAKIKDVGQYYVWASEGFYLYGLNGTNIENYTVGEDPISSKEKYDITPISVFVEAWFQSKTEGSPDPELTYVVWRDYGSDKGNQQYNEGLLSEDVFSGALSRAPGEDLGKYDIYLGTLNSPNYIISFENGENMFAILPMAQITTDSGSTSALEAQEAPIASNPLFPKLFLSGMAIIGGAFFMKMRNI